MATTPKTKNNTYPVYFKKALVRLADHRYIYVTDTPWFAQTDDKNEVTLDLPDGEYTMTVWHSRFKTADAERKQTVSLAGNQPLTFTLVVDDFGVKYINKDDTHHLANVLGKYYETSKD